MVSKLTFFKETVTKMALILDVDNADVGLQHSFSIKSSGTKLTLERLMVFMYNSYVFFHFAILAKKTVFV